MEATVRDGVRSKMKRTFGKFKAGDLVRVCEVPSRFAEAYGALAIVVEVPIDEWDKHITAKNPPINWIVPPPSKRRWVNRDAHPSCDLIPRDEFVLEVIGHADD